MKSMIVDDDAFSRRILEKMLTPFGECVAESEAVSALDAYLDALEENKPFNLICCDILMPLMDGHEFLAKVRKAESQARIPESRSVYVIMTSSAATPENVREALVKGRCKTFLVKPVDRDRLYKELLGLKLVSELDLAKTRD